MGNKRRRKLCDHLLPTTLALAALLSLSKGSKLENVYITSSYGQLVTSSTLRWEWTSSSSDYYLDPVVLRLSESSLCRGYHENRLIPGSTDHTGRCAVGFFGRVYKLDKYQVMVDNTGTTRLEWRAWDIFTKLPVGMVAYTEENQFVARVKRGSGFRFGDLNPRRGLSGDIALYDKAQSGGKEEYLTEGGEALVEIEPVKYELRSIDFDHRGSKVRKEQVRLGSHILTRSDKKDSTSSYAMVRSVIAYNASYHYYWGQHPPGLIRTLPTTASELTGTKKLEFSWGLPLDFARHRILEVAHSMLPGTSVQCVATGQKTTTEVPYSAKLVSVFGDGKTKRRIIRGTYVETLLTDVETEYGRPFYTRNGTRSPTTTSATTTTARTTTTNSPMALKTTPPATLRPAARRRTTTPPLPTEENPLLRFYPTLSDEEEAFWHNKTVDRDRKPYRRSSPNADSLSSSASTTATSRAFLLLVIIFIINSNVGGGSCF